MENDEQLKLNKRLLDACCELNPDYSLIESLLRQGARPLGKVHDMYGYEDNLYSLVITEFDLLPPFDKFTEKRSNLYDITALFIKYGMNLSNPDVPYGNLVQLTDAEGNEYRDDIFHPLTWFAFASDENFIRTLKLLLDNGLGVEDAAACWGFALDEWINYGESFDSDDEVKSYFNYVRTLLLIISYPHIINNDECLRKEIWYDYNNYDLTKFREWNNYRFEIDTSHCERYPKAYKSITTIIEKETDKPVWKFGISITPEELQR